ncbi:MAG: NADPH:quinone oxidoreductase family protein [Stappiaceae bacterium]
MKAVLCRDLGGIDALTVSEIEPPVVRPGAVIVRVKAAALNFFDTLIVAGKYQFKPDLPFSPGGEIAGIVEQIGEGVTRFQPGDRVVAYLKWGGCREQVIVEESDLVPMPDALPFDIAAGVSITYGTAMHAFFRRAHLQRGETVAILGASGGAGLAALEIARQIGARVIACASSSKKLELARQFGADETIDYTTDNLKMRLKELTGGRGVDVVYDPVGGDLAEQALRATTWRGRFLTVGYASGTIPKIPLNLALLKGCDILGVFWGDALVREPDDNIADIEKALLWVADGSLKPLIHARYPLQQTATALRGIANRRAIGKIIIQMNET